MCLSICNAIGTKCTISYLWERDESLKFGAAHNEWAKAKGWPEGRGWWERDRESAWWPVLCA